MVDPNRNTLWGRAIIEELVRAGIDTVCIAPGSRSTPLTTAAYNHDSLKVESHLDERSMAYYAVGRGRKTGSVTPIISTSGTATANFHPAVIEANRGRVPLLVLTADRPPELQDSGANQTIDQQKLYGDAVRWHQTLPEPDPSHKTVRSLRTTIARAVMKSSQTPAGPVHLNIPFRKPLEPIEVEDDVPADLSTTAAKGRAGSFVSTIEDNRLPASVEPIVDQLRAARRPLIVAGPTWPAVSAREGVYRLAAATGAPVLADPLSGCRFGSDTEKIQVCGGYDAYLDASMADQWASPDVVLRVGASPTSKGLRKYLKAADADQFIIDPAGEWSEAEFTATDLVLGDPDQTLLAVAEQLKTPVTADSWQNRFQRAENLHWESIADKPRALEGMALYATMEVTPDPATVVVSNSMPVRDLDRFGRPRSASISVIGNRGASGIDGITSTAFGAAGGGNVPAVLFTGDLAFYHDMNGLLAARRQGIDLTIVLINNDGGGIFHKLPIEDFDPPFTEGFKTPHGIDFEPSGDLYGIPYERVDSIGELTERYSAAIGATEPRIIEIRFDADRSHTIRERLASRVKQSLRE